MNTSPLSARAAIRIRKPPSEAFAAFADADSMSRFWFTRRDDGLKAGEAVTWFLGDGEEALAFDVFVKEIRDAEKIVIEWVGPDGNSTEVTWTFDEADAGETIMKIEETGFSGDSDAIVERVLDSTCGFNQVILAAKAWIEHGIALNVVADHA